ncbi:MAG: replication-associated recombination protein A [Candidatus Moranbacteria bacterium]|nr:replication-associated recombination protein A [Candidatus Moranbacteria bacterium]
MPTPLPDLIRPQNLIDFFGQEKLIGKNSYLFRAIENDNVPSMILWGPPGSGKTTLAHIIASATKSEFLKISAVSSGKKILLEIIAKAQENKLRSIKTILFIDEIHRWNKAQQDALLPYVENGTITLIGATTENPSFEVNSALVSRTRVFVLQKLTPTDLEKIIERALEKIKTAHRGGSTSIMEVEPPRISSDTIKLLANLSNGDARMALNTLEACVNQTDNITPELIKEVLQKSHLLYDKSGEEHYNIISALHKSMRGGNTDASVYWLARMIEGGEDPLYIARRLVRFASEDIGLANNTALLLANAVFDACHKLGYPECNVHLAQCVIYLAKSKKDITAYAAYGKAKKDVEKFGNLPVPLHLRNAPTKLMKELGYGNGYKYTPLEDSTEQNYLPEELGDSKYL